MNTLQDELTGVGVDAKVIGVTNGPIFDRWEIDLDLGVKANSVYSLERHLSFVYGAPVRISSIPGRRAMGIEIPHAGTTVPLGEIISDDPHSITLGMSIDGPVYDRLDDLPHLLVAGATGSGKSVFINSVICEMIKKNRPDDLELVLIDPKRVELSMYEGLPHVRGGIVNDPLAAVTALRYVIAEMMRRYDQMQAAGVRHAKDLGLPRLVVIIDEFAELIMLGQKQVEDTVIRLAQLGRAAGIHLIVATQRPSREVFTGLIKSNIPGRLAFRTSSMVDSRVILDAKGAEQLTGRGDGLYRRNDTLVRLRAPFVSDNEIERLVKYWS